MEVKVRDDILARPPEVVVVLKVWMTRQSLGDKSPDWEAYGNRALNWWDGVLKEFRAAGKHDEVEVAKGLIQRLRQQSEGWGKILREGTV